MPENPIIPRADIESAIAKVKAYMADHKTADGMKVEPADWYGKLIVYANMPESFPINRDNRNEVAALVRALNIEDPQLTTQIVYFDPKTKAANLNIHTMRTVGVNPNEYNRDETARLKDDGKEFEERLNKALTKIANADPKELADRIEVAMTNEQGIANETYKLSRDAVKQAFKNSDHVGLLVDRAYSLGYVFQYSGAIDGAEDSGKFGSKATKPSEIQFDLGDQYLAPYKDPKTASTHVYFSTVKRAFEVQNGGQGTVYGILNARDTTPNRDVVLTNQQKREIGNANNKRNNDEYDAHMAKINGPVLTLNSDELRFPKDAVVFHGIKHLIKDEYYMDNYYPYRYTDGAKEGPTSVEWLKARYKNPGIDISGKGAENILYISLDMYDTMLANAKAAYIDKSLGIEQLPTIPNVIGFGDDVLANTITKQASTRTVTK